MSFLKQVGKCLRMFLDMVIDFFFSLYWECHKDVVPDLDKDHALLSESATSLANKIKRRELKSEDVVRAYIDRLKEVNPVLNAIAADRYIEALDEARELDKRIDDGTEDLNKPFLGVPFTTKESQAIKGMPLTMGLWCRRNKKAEEDSEAVIRLKNAGAIPLASTNLPELLIWSETRNPVYGMCNNPHHTGRSPGGSSGAEAALTASYATAISLCSDIGGSTRMPAFYCGMFGHHPTAGTTNTKGSFYRNGDEDSMYCLGFISKSVEDLAPLTKIIAGDKASLLKLDRNVDMKDIKFYYLEEGNDCLISPLRSDVKKAMHMVIKKINEGHKTVAEPYTHDALGSIYKLWAYWMGREPGDYAAMLTDGQQQLNGFAELGRKLVGISKHCLFVIMRVLEMRLMPKADKEWAEKTTKELKDDIINKLGNNGVLILPSAPHPAPYHYSFYLRPYNFAYFALVNTLKCPATQVPLGKNSQGLPLGVQIMAAPYNDALCLTVAKYLEKEFGGAVMACKAKTLSKYIHKSMATEKVIKPKREKSKHRENKSSRICKGVMMNILRNLYLIIRVFVEKLIDYAFSLYWDGENKRLPDLSKRHEVLKESAVSLAAMIRNKQLKSEDLVRTCIERIKEVNPIINSVTDERYELAIKEAKEIDESIEKGLSDEYFKEKPFLGVPFTTKESIAVSGMHNTLATLARKDTRAPADAACVRYLRAAGAIPLAVTNVPEINKWQETNNLIFGRTNNPYNVGRGAGGSSGGEAALMASLATPISLCSDIGGSTRMPAFYCGLFGYNPTAGHTSLEGNALRTGKEPTMASIGFVARHTEDLAPLTNIVAAEKAALLQLDRPVNIKDIKVFYMETSNDPLLSPVCDDLRQAMKRVIAKLSEDTSSPQPFYHRGFNSMYRLWKRGMALEAEDFAAILKDHKGRANGVVELVRKVLGMGQHTLAAILRLLELQLLPPVPAEWADNLTRETADELTRVLGTDGVLILPSAPQPAPHHNVLYLRPYNFAYWAILNALRMPAVQVPLGLNSSGLPLGVQVAAARGQDALCLAVAKHLEKAFGGYVPPCKVPQ
ncbi:uncharacterized protein LOC121735634 [Aricia agestis]|uniref:uncharacterized protein LOC121735634 n=1 Tax=Aricia agestis TaxID=91739 RepID=UPI001C207D3C|nr:uncharacterized protein LOC121735634 [Aricia agestis]